MNDVTPALSQAQIEWLSAMSGKALAGVTAPSVEDEAQAFTDVREGKDEALRRVQAMQDALNDHISENLDIKLALKGFFGGSVSMKNKNHDPLKEYDTGHHAKKIKEVDEATQKQARAALDDIRAMAEELRKRTIKRTKEDGTVEEVPMFTDAEIDEAVHTPLLRQGVIPENAIPDRHSRFVKHFNGANALYDEKLQEFTDAQSSRDRVAGYFTAAAEWLQPGVDVAAAALTAPKAICGSIEKDIKAGRLDVDDAFKAKLEEHKKNADMPALIATQLTLAPKLLTGMGMAVKMPGNAARDITASLTGTLMNVLKVAGAPKAEDVAKGITQALNSAVKDSGVLELIANERTGDALAKLADTVDKNVPGLGDGKTEKLFAKIGTSLSKGILKAEDAACKQADSLIRKAPPQAMKLLVGAIAKAVDSQLAADQGAVTEAASELSEEDGDAVVASMNDRLQAVEDEIMMGAAESEAAETSDLLDRAMTVYDAASVDVETHAANTIGAVLAKVQATQAKLKRAEQAAMFITKVGGAVAAKAFASVPGIGDIVEAANALRDIAIDALKAARAAKELLKWHDGLKKAKIAMSPVLDAIHNIHGNRVWEVMKKGIDIAFNVVKMIASITAAIGAAVPQASPAVLVGKITTQVAGVTQKGVQAMLTYYQKGKLEKAWYDYKKAISNPYDRIMMHKALRENPTLAKYSVAYGALEEKDPVAVKVMNSLGINDEALEDKNAKAGDIVEFLETLYPDDPTLIRALPQKKDWHPKEALAFTVKSWLAHLDAAKKNGMVDGSNMGKAVAGPLTGLPWYVKKFDEACGRKGFLPSFVREPGDQLTAAYDEIIAALSGFDPVDAQGKLHGMAEVADYFVEEAKRRREEHLVVLEKAIAEGEENERNMQAAHDARNARRRRGRGRSGPVIGGHREAPVGV